MKGKGQGLGIQMLVIAIFLSLIAFLLLSFFYPESFLGAINNTLKTIQNLRWEEIITFALIVVVILITSVLLVLFHFTKIFEEREV